ncbi:Trk system potassium transporter TrkA [Desulfobacterota bacterium AH_259_B03_O07]|nr:Trk system potassium transporter TrkA [Desulfobacterota bacterium AH_259_B03_O07]
MHIIIIGAGQIGDFLAKNLSAEHDIVIVENNRESVEKIKETHDVSVIQGEGDNPAVLKEANIDNADVLLAVSGDDRVNIMSSSLASSLGVSKIIIRIRDTNYLEYHSTLKGSDIHVVNPSEIISEKIISLVSSPFAWKTETLGAGKIKLFKLKIEDDTPISGKKLSDLGPAKAWIFVAISRDGEITIPTGETTLKSGDYIFALGIPSVMDKLKKLFGVKDEFIKNAIIVGGGRVGRKVSNSLTEKGISVKLIESDPDRARLAAEELPKVRVFNGDANDGETLKEAGAESADYFVALTGDDENNVLSALLAKNLGAKKTTVLYTKPDYIDVLEAIGVDRAISVRLSVANEILSLLHIGGVAHVALVEEGRAEVLEFDITEKMGILGIPFRDANFPDGAIVGIVVRDNEVIIPRGDFIPNVNDRLIIFALPQAVKKVEKMLC